MKLAQAATGGGGKKSKAAAAQPAQRPMFVEVMKYRSIWGCSCKHKKAAWQRKTSYIDAWTVI